MKFYPEVNLISVSTKLFNGTLSKECHISYLAIVKQIQKFIYYHLLIWVNLIIDP